MSLDQRVHRPLIWHPFCKKFIVYISMLANYLRSSLDDVRVSASEFGRGDNSVHHDWEKKDYV